MLSIYEVQILTQLVFTNSLQIRRISKDQNAPQLFSAWGIGQITIHCTPHTLVMGNRLTPFSSQSLELDVFGAFNYSSPTTFSTN